MVKAIAQPTTAATTPTKSASDVISLFSDAYTNVSGTDWFPNWGQSTVVTDILVATNNTKRYTTLNYQGVQFASPVNAASMSNLHMDIWTPNCTAFDVFLINTSPAVEQKVTLTPTLSGWNSFDILLSQYNLIALSNIGQLKFVGTPSGTSTVYIDNIYFWKSASTPSLSGFSVPSQLLGAAPFTLTPPTSNSTGAFTYTSSNTSVATISGDVVTVVGVGTSIITANQAPAGSYTAGTTSASLVVSYPPPTTAATTPTKNASDVISLYSDAYTNVSGTDWFPNWGQSTVVSDVLIATNNTKKYEYLNYQGVQFASPVNAASMSNLHMDIWTPNCTAFDVFLINTSPAVEQKVTLTPTSSGWNSFDILLSQYNLIALNNIGQMKLVGTPSGTSTVYIDNIYFWKSASAPTLSGFSVPAQLLGAAPFTLTPPTSNSTGAFTYTSSNTSVATISGNVVTVVGVGTSIITANQAPAGSYIAGTTSAALVVSYPPPTTAATTPTRSAANVISLFSDAYTNVAGTDWFPYWGQSTVVSDVSIATNNTKKYEYLNYQGVQFASPVNAASMSNLHMDIWTPNCTAFEVFLINTSPAVEQKVTLTPTLSGWNSFDILLSQYNLIALNNIGQMKLVGTPSGTSTVYLDNIYFWNNAITPVSIVNFNAIKDANKVSIKWQTASEVNNKGFYVQKSNNGSTWNNISFVAGIGTTNAVTNYNAEDLSPIKGTNYYRLAQVDNDGKQTYSSVASVKFAANDGMGITFYPNPVKSKLTVQLDNILNNRSSLNLINVEGKIVKSTFLNQQNSNTTVSFDVANISRGVYYLVIKDGQTTKTSKVIIE
jgi:hypothetical protein